MSEAFSPDTPQQLVTDLCRLVAERAAAEKELLAGQAAYKQRVGKEFQETQQRLHEQYRADKAAAEKEYASSRSGTAARFESEHAALEQGYKEARAAAIAHFTADERAAEQALQDAHWRAMETADAARGNLNMPLNDLLAGLDGRWQELANIHRQAVELLVQRGHWDEMPAAGPIEVILEKHAGRRFCHALEQAKTQYATLANQRLPRLFQGFRPWVILAVLWLASAVPLMDFFGWRDWRWAAISLGFTALFSSIAGTVLSFKALRQSKKAYLDLRQTLLQAGLGFPNVLEAAKAECERMDTTILARHKQQVQEAEEVHTAALAKIEKNKREELEAAENTFPKRMAELVAWRDRTMKEIEEKYPALLRRIEQRYEADAEQLDSRHARARQENQERFERQWKEMSERWQSGLERFQGSTAELQQLCRETFPDWNTDDWRRWKAPTAIPPVIRFGGGRIELAAIKGGVPEDKRLAAPQTECEMPVVLPYPRKSLLLLKGSGAGLGKAVDVMQSAMLRLLTAMPPSKVRFTIIDPVGLGDNFSAFMHLADYDEQLVASRIWTDSAHIEQRLADLTKHMENVIQVYLRKEFHSIEEYNAFAGEMAEPYRVLVVANFPANFSEAAADRIKSIVASGAQCGVFVLMSVDEKLAFPRNFQLRDLERDAMVLPWTEPEMEADAAIMAGAEGGFVWQHPEYGPMVVNVPPPPSPERYKQILRVIGSAARESGRVEVSFSCVAPQDKEWWTADSRGGLDVPLGRAGAMKLQHLDLGGGTSQHVLISGKTGSGKSTLLHVLITNLALRYSPDEVELYLVDFKKGVEFKAYARNELPHARVIAIESEREFGLSVLQRLDAELRSRGDLFRGRGVQDIKSFRAAEPGVRMPRILLVIDEFQELFVEDDRISQETALLLDRLVRQGRAFGIHVLLGSQTLGGAYTLARSTIGQMAVRIALQCSESDAHLILSEDNTAARLLTRPGEAIYNDANGLYEGNHPFQIVWLSDGDRDDYLQRIRRLAQQRGCTTEPPIVFEGNVPAELGGNQPLRTLMEAKSWPESAPAVPAWLGAAVAIKEPTAAVFMRQNGSNLLMVGHREEAAIGVSAACFLSLAAQLPPAGNPHPSPLPKGEGTGTGARFFILDGMRADATEIGFWNRLTAVAPHAVKVAGVRGTGEIIAEVAGELNARQQEEHEDRPPIYLFVYNLGRFRDLRKDEDYGFSSGDDSQPNPAKQFAAILREGPPLGIHTIVWCDTFSNVTRMLDRQSLRDFEMRVLFQMNANDSSSLMDSPEAGKLGVHRAFFYDEGQGRMEKFRPYGPASAELLACVKKQLQGRA